MKPTKKVSQKDRSELEAVIKNSKRYNIETRRAQAILLLCDNADENLIRSLTGFNKSHSFKKGG